MTFPFEVPADLSKLSADDLAAFATKVRDFAKTTLADADAPVETLAAVQEKLGEVKAEQDTRKKAADARAALAADLVEPEPEVEETEPETEDDPEPETKPETEETPEVETKPADQPTTASKGKGKGTLDLPEKIAETRYARITGGPDSKPGELEDFGAAVDVIQSRIGSYSSSTSVNLNARRARGRNRFVMNGRTMQRHGNVAIRREYPAELRVTNPQDTARMLEALEFASNERRLPGGSLAKSAELAVKGGKSLTAAVGWCAPSEIIYDLCELESMDGMLDVPEIQAARGGFQTPINGGPDFSVIWDSIGDDGDVILTEYDVENGTEKVCVEIPCPDFQDTRLDVAYVCITGNFLQERGYPEAVARFTRGAMVALAHKVNESVIARMEAGSGSLHTISPISGSDDAVSSLLAAIELAIEDMKYRHRMARSTTMEVVLPYWVLPVMRAAMSRRHGTATVNVSDAELLSWFTTRGAVPRFVYDWQDAFSGLANSPGGATAITAFPATVKFMVYPAGTWVKPVRDVVNLDTVYDNALLTQNQFTALFAEDGFNMIKMCVDSRVYSATISPNGIVGCCP